MPISDEELKKRYGALLLKFKKGAGPTSAEELDTAKALEGKGLTHFVDMRVGSPVGKIEDYWARVQSSAMSFWELSGSGEEFVIRHSDDELSSGDFLFHGERPTDLVEKISTKARSHPWFAWTIVIVLAVAVATSAGNGIVSFLKSIGVVGGNDQPRQQ